MMRWSAAVPPRPGCPHRRLRFLLARELPPASALGASTFRPWASANFVGARHIFPCALTASDGAALQARLSATEWALPGHIVADIVVEGGAEAGAFQVEILTVED